MENSKKHEGEETIPRGIPDPFYRYWMPKLELNIEGRGNGRTVLTNLAAVAASLDRPPSYLMKYFSVELGAPTSEDPFIISGGHSLESLVKILDGFIDKFVLCKEDNNPETTLSVTAKGDIHLSCKACGCVGRADMKHKAASFIVKNPPTPAKKDKSVLTKAEKRAAKIKKQQERAKNSNLDE